MKGIVLKRGMVLLVVCSLLSLMVIYGCGASDLAAGATGGTCVTSAGYGRCSTIKSCASGSGSTCWYEAGGQTFNCSGCSCSGAATSLVNYCNS